MLDILWNFLKLHVPTILIWNFHTLISKDSIWMNNSKLNFYLTLLICNKCTKKFNTFLVKQSLSILQLFLKFVL